MPTSKSAWRWVDLGLKMDNAEFADADSMVVSVPVPVEQYGKIMAARLSCATLPTNATVALAKSGGVNFVTVASKDCASLTTGTAFAFTILTNQNTVTVRSVDTLTATWTLTSKGAGDGYGLLVAVEPSGW